MAAGKEDSLCDRMDVYRDDPDIAGAGVDFIDVSDIQH